MRIHVSQEGSICHLRSSELTVTLDLQTLALDVENESGGRWSTERVGRDLQMLGGAIDLGQVVPEKIVVPLQTTIRGRRFEGLRLTLTTLPEPGRPLPAVTIDYLLAEDAADFAVEVDFPDGHEIVGLTGLSYPRPFRLAVDAAIKVVLPAMQGSLLATNDLEPYSLEATTYTRGLYMPWWGVVGDGAAYMGILETPDDGQVVVEHPTRGPTRVGPRWIPSLGRLRYPRRVLYSFFPGADHVALARRYRRYIQDTGRWRTFQEKVDERATVRKLIGSVIVPLSICRHDLRQSPTHHDVISFSQRTEDVIALKETWGFDNALIHVDGWGTRGYDNLHPDILPPCLEAGGYTGLKKLCDTAKDLGYLFGLHDQYRDFYLDAPSYDRRQTIKNTAQQEPTYTRWCGGPQSVLCATQALSYVRRNMEGLWHEGISPTASYLDVFSIVPLDECHDPSHPMTRSDCREYRSACFRFMTEHGIVLSSEEAVDWATPDLDFVYWAPLYQKDGLFKGAYLGTPVPLHELVYHDALVVPWRVETPEQFLQCLLYGGVPLMSSNRSPAYVGRVKLLSRVHEAVGGAEMVQHRLLSTEGIVQETEFASDVRIRVDFAAERFYVQGVDGIPPYERGWDENR